MGLYRHTATYLLGRVGPALIALFAVGVYTRLVPPEEFGLYVLTLSVALFANRVLFQWLRVAIVRFAPRYGDRKNDFSRTVLVTFGALAVFAVLLGLILWLALADHRARHLIPFGVAALVALGWFELGLELLRVRLEAARYAMAYLIRAGVTLAVSWLLIEQGLGSRGLLLGMAVGWSIAPLPFLRSLGDQSASPGSASFDGSLVREVSRYGLPLTLAFLLDGIITTADRVLLGWLDSVESAGLYGVAADLGTNTLLVLAQSVHLAAMPLVVHALEDRGREAALDELRGNLRILLAIGLPATVGFSLLAGNISNVVLGADYRDTAELLLPLVAVATFFNGLRAYYVDQSFQLGRRTEIQIWVAAVAALTAVVANILLIPPFGVVGAAWSTLLTYSLALVLAWVLARRVFPLPVPSVELLRVALAVVLMAPVLWWLAPQRGTGWLAIQVAAGASVYVGLLLLIDGAGLRTALRSWLARRRAAAG